jgi:hypothetical protein
MDFVFLNLFYRADLSRALQLLLYSIEIFSYFYYVQFRYQVRLICQYDAGHYLIHIITGFIICIISAITQQ